MENIDVESPTPIRRRRIPGRIISRIIGKPIKRTYRSVSGARDLTVVELLRAWYIRSKWLLFGVIVGYVLYRVDIFEIIEEWFKSLYRGMYG